MTLSGFPVLLLEILFAGEEMARLAVPVEQPYQMSLTASKSVMKADLWH